MHNQMLLTELLFLSIKIYCFSNLDQQRLELTAGHEKNKSTNRDANYIIVYRT